MSDKVQCVCGSLLKKITSSHLKTKKHLKWVEMNSPKAEEKVAVSVPKADEVIVSSYVPNLVEKQAERFRVVKDDGEQLDEHCRMIEEEHRANHKAYLALPKKEKSRLRAMIPKEDRLPIELDDEGRKASKKKRAGILTQNRMKRRKKRGESDDDYQKRMEAMRDPREKRRGESVEEYQERMLKLDGLGNTASSSVGRIQDIQRRYRELVN